MTGTPSTLIDERGLVGGLFSLPAPARQEAFAVADSLRRIEPFVDRIFPGNFAWNWHHRIICDRLNQVAWGDITRLMVFVPPRHGKTELCSKLFPAWLLARDPNVQIISGAYGADHAREYNRSCQRLIDSEAYRHAYPWTRLNSRNVRTMARAQGDEVMALRNTDEFEIVGAKGFYKSAGIMGGVTGRGCNFLILDDPVKGRRDADSPAIRRRIWGEYTSSFYTRLESYQGADARIVLILTRWHEDDLAGQLLDQEGRDDEGGKWNVVRFPAILDEPAGNEDPRELGEALWPDKRSVDDWATFQQLHPQDYESLGQQRPRRAGGDMFRSAAFRWYGGPPPPRVKMLGAG